MSNYQQFRILKTNACSMVGRPQKGMRQPKKPVSFEQLVLNRDHKTGKERGRLHTSTQVLLEYNGPVGLRSCELVADFKREYYSEYLSKFYL